ncbi:MAG: hypothetical protein AB7F29_14175 [Candidatus Nitrosocosmicus sp.]
MSFLLKNSISHIGNPFCYCNKLDSLVTMGAALRHLAGSRNNNHLLKHTRIHNKAIVSVLIRVMDFLPVS